MNATNESLAHLVGLTPDRVLEKLLTVLSTERAFWLFYLAVALIYFIVNESSGLRKNGPIVSARLFLDYLLPKEIRSKKSFSIDVQWYLLTLLGFYDFSLKFLTQIFFLRTIPSLFRFFRVEELPPLIALHDYVKHLGVLQIPLIFFTALLAYDFGGYFGHRLLHKYELLWQFHKGHHYSTQLNYLSTTRAHPLDLFLTFNIAATFCLTLALCLLVPIDDKIFSGIGAFADPKSWCFLIAMVLPGFFARLNHSHFPIHFGKTLGRILVSPASHSVHHSKTIIDKNFGQFFSFWDVTFGTYHQVYSKKEAEFHLQNMGVNETPEDSYNDIIEFLLLPFKDSYHLIKKKRKDRAAAKDQIGRSKIEAEIAKS